MDPNLLHLASAHGMLRASEGPVRARQVGGGPPEGDSGQRRSSAASRRAKRLRISGLHCSLKQCRLPRISNMASDRRWASSSTCATRARAPAGSRSPASSRLSMAERPCSRSRCCPESGPTIMACPPRLKSARCSAAASSPVAPAQRNHWLDVSSLRRNYQGLQCLFSSEGSTKPEACKYEGAKELAARLTAPLESLVHPSETFGPCPPQRCCLPTDLHPATFSPA
jgi:hypothetical protein